MPKSTKDLKADISKTKFFFYGPPGSHKTWCAGTFPKPYFFDFDDGMMILRDKDISYDSYQDGDKATPTAWNQLIATMRQWSMPDAKLQYETLVLDSLTTIADACKRQLKAEGGANKMDGLSQPQWGQFIERITELFYLMQRIQATVIVIAHDRLVVDDLTGGIMNQLLVQTKDLPTKIPVFFDEVYYFNVEMVGGQSKFRTRTQRDAKRYAKSRLGLEPIEDDLEYKRILEVISK